MNLAAPVAGKTPPSEPLLLVVLGPTGSGKTELSLTLAERFHGEIISCDSIAVYRGLSIGAAKPSPEQLRRVPHHLLDILTPGEFITAGEYARRARRVLGEIQGRRRMPVVAGGTGLYLRALLEGLFAGPERSAALRERLRTRGRQRGPAYLHRMLRRLDPMAAAQIHPNDAPKAIRAIEVCLQARRPISQLWEAGRDPLRGFRVLKIGLNPPRPALYARLNQRGFRMFEQGLLEETQRLLECYPNSWALSAQGYRQAAQFLRGEITREQALAAVQQAHRNYAKRQMTWFRRESEVGWLHGFGDDEAIQREARMRVEDALACAVPEEAQFRKPRPPFFSR